MYGISTLPGSWVVFRLLLRGHPRDGRTSGIVQYIGRIVGKHSGQIQAHQWAVVVAEVEEGFEERVEAGFALHTGTVGMGWEAMALKELPVVECWLSAAEPVLCVLPVAVVAASTVYAGPPTTCASRRRPLTATV